MVLRPSGSLMVRATESSHGDDSVLSVSLWLPSAAPALRQLEFFDVHASDFGFQVPGSGFRVFGIRTLESGTGDLEPGTRNP